MTDPNTDKAKRRATKAAGTLTGNKRPTGQEGHALHVNDPAPKNVAAPSANKRPTGNEGRALQVNGPANNDAD